MQTKYIWIQNHCDHITLRVTFVSLGGDDVALAPLPYFSTDIANRQQQ